MSDNDEPLEKLFGSVKNVYRNVEKFKRKFSTRSDSVDLPRISAKDSETTLINQTDNDIRFGLDKQPNKRCRISDSRVVGMSSHFDPHLLQFLDNGRLGNVRFQHVNSDTAFPVHFLLPPPNVLTVAEQYATEITAQRVRIRNMVKGTEPRLLELFFELVYPVYPIIDPKQFYAAYNHPGNTDNIDVGLLAGVLAISVSWTKYDPALCMMNFPRQLHDNLFAECLVAVERTLKKPTVETVQGLLLLMQWQTEQHEDFRAQLNRSKLVSVAFSFGLHLNCHDWNISSDEKIMRERLWWSVYLVEKWVSTNLGVPSAITLENTTWNCELFVSDNAEIPLFKNFIKLTRILDKVITDLYSLRGCKERYLDVTTTIAKADEYLTELERWRTELPPEIREMSPRSAMELKQNGILHLSELTVSVLLHRIKLRPMCSHNHRIPRHEVQAYRAQSYATIQRIIAFTSCIANSHIKTFWHTMARYNFSTLFSFLVFYNLTSLTKREFNNSKIIMEKWNKTLQGLSKSWPSGPALAVERGNTAFGVVLEEDSNSMLTRYTEESGSAETAGTASVAVKRKRAPKKSVPVSSAVPLKSLKKDNNNNKNSNSKLQKLDFTTVSEQTPSALSTPTAPLALQINDVTKANKNDNGNNGNNKNGNDLMITF